MISSSTVPKRHLPSTSRVYTTDPDVPAALNQEGFWEAILRHSWQMSKPPQLFLLSVEQVTTIPGLERRCPWAFSRYSHPSCCWLWRCDHADRRWRDKNEQEYGLMGAQPWCPLTASLLETDFFQEVWFSPPVLMGDPWSLVFFLNPWFIANTIEATLLT